MGQIRFQWWRDAVRAAFDGRPPSHPVALALAHVIASSRATGTTGAGPTATVAASGRATGMDNGAGDAAGGRHAGCGSGCGVDRGPANGAEEGDASAAAAAGAHASSSAAARMQGAGGGGGMAGSSPYSRYSFKRIIDAREADFLDPQPPLELAALESYAEGTASQLMYLQVRIGGPWRDYLPVRVPLSGITTTGAERQGGGWAGGRRMRGAGAVTDAVVWRSYAPNKATAAASRNAAQLGGMDGPRVRARTHMPAGAT